MQGGRGGGRGAAVGGERGATARGPECDHRGGEARAQARLRRSDLPPRGSQEPSRREAPQHRSWCGPTLATARGTDRRGPTRCHGLEITLFPRLLPRLSAWLLRPAKAARRASPGEGGWRARGRWYAAHDPALGGACYDEEPFSEARPRRVGARRFVRRVGESHARGGLREAARAARRERAARAEAVRGRAAGGARAGEARHGGRGVGGDAQARGGGAAAREGEGARATGRGGAPCALLPLPSCPLLSPSPQPHPLPSTTYFRIPPPPRPPTP